MLSLARPLQVLRGRCVAVLMLCATLLGLLALSAPMANAEPSAFKATFTSCPALAATCTRYWSVNRTKEFNNEEKAIQMGAYAGSATLVTIAATAVGAPEVALPADAYAVYKIGEFDVQLSSAANDHRCLIYKFPKGVVDAGWWGSVSSTSNSQCKKAGEKDSEVFS